MAKILIVDDDESLLAMATAFFEGEKYVVESATSAEDAEDILAVSQFDALIIDWSMSGKSGLELIQTLRGKKDKTPIIMLTGHTDIDDKERGLDDGADDYLTKPFNMRELGVRIRALLRRASSDATNILSCGGVTLDTKTRKCTVSGGEVILLPKEYSLLEFLMRHPGESFSNDALIGRVWQSDTEATENAIRTCIMRLRKKLTSAGEPENRIENINRIGYRINS